MRNRFFSKEVRPDAAPSAEFPQSNSAAPPSYQAERRPHNTHFSVSMQRETPSPANYTLNNSYGAT